MTPSSKLFNNIRPSQSSMKNSFRIVPSFKNHLFYKMPNPQVKSSSALKEINTVFSFAPLLNYEQAKTLVEIGKLTIYLFLPLAPRRTRKKLTARVNNDL